MVVLRTEVDDTLNSLLYGLVSKKEDCVGHLLGTLTM